MARSHGRPLQGRRNRPLTQEIVLVAEVDLERLPARAHGWKDGPLPLARQEGGEADRTWRETYFDGRVSAALYETEVRWYKRLSSPESILVTAGGLEVTAVELLRLAEVSRPSPDAFLIIHGRPEGDVDLPALLEGLSRISPESQLPALIEELLDRMGRLHKASKRMWTLALHVPAEELQRRDWPDDYGDWQARDQWLWEVASATTIATYPPAPEARDELVEAESVRLSADWTALVLRDGVAFVGNSPARFLAETAPVLIRTIYLDALLLGKVQSRWLARIAGDIAELGDPGSNPERLEQIERRLNYFRNVFWWQHLTPHGPANVLLRRYQGQHALPELASQIVSELADYSRQAGTAAAARSNALLAALTLVGFPAATALGILQVLGADRWVDIGIAMGAALIVTLLLFALPSARVSVNGILASPEDSSGSRRDPE